MKNIFRFDVTLKDLMNLGQRAKDFTELNAVFAGLHAFWYNLDDKEAQKERENRIRVGSVKVYLDDEYHLHIDFITRFNLENSKPFLDLLNYLRDKDEV
jgi:hypothetical protein